MPQSSDTINSDNTVRISEQFEYVASRSFDNKYRINLGQKIFKILSKLFPFKSFNIYVSPEGYLLLEPVNIIPSNELWIWKNPEIKASFERALEDAHEGRFSPVEDLDHFLDSL